MRDINAIFKLTGQECGEHDAVRDFDTVSRLTVRG